MNYSRPQQVDDLNYYQGNNWGDREAYTRGPLASTGVGLSERTVSNGNCSNSLPPSPSSSYQSAMSSGNSSYHKPSGAFRFGAPASSGAFRHGNPNREREENASPYQYHQPPPQHPMTTRSPHQVYRPQAQPPPHLQYSGGYGYIQPPVQPPHILPEPSSYGAYYPPTYHPYYGYAPHPPPMPQHGQSYYPNPCYQQGHLGYNYAGHGHVPPGYEYPPNNGIQYQSYPHPPMPPEQPKPPSVSSKSDDSMDLDDIETIDFSKELEVQNRTQKESDPRTLLSSYRSANGNEDSSSAKLTLTDPRVDRPKEFNPTITTTTPIQKTNSLKTKHSERKQKSPTKLRQAPPPPVQMNVPEPTLPLDVILRGTPLIDQSKKDSKTEGLSKSRTQRKRPLSPTEDHDLFLSLSKSKHRVSSRSYAAKPREKQRKDGEDDSQPLPSVPSESSSLSDEPMPSINPSASTEIYSDDTGIGSVGHENGIPPAPPPPCFAPSSSKSTQEEEEPDRPFFDIRIRTDIFDEEDNDDPPTGGNKERDSSSEELEVV